MNRPITRLLPHIALAVVLSAAASPPVDAAEQSGSRPTTAVGTEASVTPEAMQPEPFSDEELAWEEIRPMGDAMFIIETDYAADFAYAHFAGTTAVIGFRGAAPEEALTILEAASQDFRVEEHVTYTYTDYQLAAERLGEDIKERADAAGLTLDALLTGPAPQDGAGVISATVVSTDGADLSALGEIARTTPVAEPFRTNVVEGSDPPEDLQYNRHGGTWLVDPTGLGACTSSFVAKQSSGPRLGVVTAGHCPNSLRYYNDLMGA
ncbi:S1 family peptidase [Aeromicrobium sp. Leaf350]|uniref:S1 family peptidase n=1 Tax=Aeromicrobium sp. Leaf350 TaxID=2876565 RepID=UPI001E5BE5D7|nr:S1 family peptidase [Aeromicrobium sp. Leaf350]